MQSVRSTIVALLGCLLLLGGCLSSEIPVLSVSELAVPADLPGRYWQLDMDPAEIHQAVEFSAPVDGTFTYRSPDEPWPTRLVKTIDPDVFVMIVDETEKNRANYYLLRRASAGIWGIDLISLPEPNAVGDKGAAAFRGVLRKHGFEVGRQDHGDHLMGTPDADRLLALLRDPAFLGGLIRRVGVLLYPGRIDKLVELPEPMLDSPARLDPLVTAHEGLAKADRLAVPDLSGSFVPGNADARFTSAAAVTVRADGRYSVKLPWGERELSLLAIAGSDTKFIAAMDYYEPRDGALRTSWHIAYRTGNSWAFHPIRLNGYPQSPAFDALVRQAVAEAVRPHGFTPGDHMLAGPVSAATIWSLFADGAFQAVILIDEDPEFTLGRP